MVKTEHLIEIEFGLKDDSKIQEIVKKAEEIKKCHSNIRIVIRVAVKN